MKTYTLTKEHKVKITIRNVTFEGVVKFIDILIQWDGIKIPCPCGTEYSGYSTSMTLSTEDVPYYPKNDIEKKLIELYNIYFNKNKRRKTLEIKPEWIVIADDFVHEHLYLIDFKL